MTSDAQRSAFGTLFRPLLNLRIRTRLTLAFCGVFVLMVYLIFAMTLYLLPPQAH